jgi:geranylgeranyl diphosphate synthase type II
VATVADTRASVGTLASPPPSGREKAKRPSTAHLKAVPETRQVRDHIRGEAARYCQPLDRSRPFTKQQLQERAEELLQQLGLGTEFLGFTMVLISNEFWREQIQAIPFSRRLLLLPHCLKHAEGCPADYDEFGLDCRKCGACSVADFKGQAEDLGYKVLVSEGTPIVLKIIVSGHVDAIVGVACLNVLEKAIDKILLAGIPCVAVPLHSSNCRNTSVDEDWVTELIDLQTPPPAVRTRTYVHLMRAAHQTCEQPELSRLAPRKFSAGMNGKPLTDPLVVHENIAYDWLAQGGKRSRPFITLAVYDALRGGEGTFSEEATQNIPDAVRKAALAIEVFHKASLVHDDIEDDDTFRYGRETLHRQYGVSTAINVGDYLVGLGYRLVSRESKELGGECTADILGRLSEAHLRLSEGQGAELLWRDSQDKALTPLDALKIYALKTAPAFEAALYSGVRLAGDPDGYEKPVAEFSKNLGVAFQILNDLKDWQTDSDNKLVAGQDVLKARPTLLLALGLEGSSPQGRQEILELLGRDLGADASGSDGAGADASGSDGAGADASGSDGAGADASGSEVVSRVQALFTSAGVFAKAEKLVEKYRARAEAIADDIEPTELRELLYYLVDTVLDRQPGEEPAPPPLLQVSVS